LLLLKSDFYDMGHCKKKLLFLAEGRGQKAEMKGSGQWAVGSGEKAEK
jgi:hypothetical protein